MGGFGKDKAQGRVRAPGPCGDTSAAMFSHQGLSVELQGLIQIRMIEITAFNCDLNQPAGHLLSVIDFLLVLHFFFYPFPCRKVKFY